MKTFKEIALVSGGVDSVLVTAAVPSAQPLFIDYGQPESASEVEAVHRLWPHAQVICVLAGRPDRAGTYYPARNLWLSSCAVMFYGAEKVWLGGMKDDFCADKTPEAFAAMSTILSAQAGHQVSIDSPFWHQNKATAIQEALARGLDRERLVQTFSCYSPVNGQPCRECPACFRRSVALLVNGLPAPPLSLKMAREYLGKLAHYDEERRWTIIKAIQLSGGKVHGIDIDGTLTVEVEGHDYATRTPNVGMIEWLRGKRASGDFIVLWTSRKEQDREVTLKWLADHNVPHDGLLFHKPSFNLIVDDRCLRMPR